MDPYLGIPISGSLDPWIPTSGPLSICMCSYLYIYIQNTYARMHCYEYVQILCGSQSVALLDSQLVSPSLARPAPCARTPPRPRARRGRGRHDDDDGGDGRRRRRRRASRAEGGEDEDGRDGRDRDDDGGGSPNAENYGVGNPGGGGRRRGVSPEGEGPCAQGWRDGASRANRCTWGPQGSAGGVAKSQLDRRGSVSSISHAACHNQVGEGTPSSRRPPRTGMGGR